MLYDRDDVELEVLLYDALVDVCPDVLLVASDDGRDAVTAGFL